MVHLKTSQEIQLMKEGGEKLRNVVSELIPWIKEGITTNQIDKQADTLLKKFGAESSFKKVPGYKWSTCLPINEQTVHTPPSERKLQYGDVLTVDIGAFYKGFHTDYATTIVIGNNPDEKVKKFLSVGKQTLQKAIAEVQNGKYIGNISDLIQKEIYGNGYFILRELTGHGLGKELHEDPYIPGYVQGPIEKTYKIRPGLVIAVEIIYSMGTEEIAYESKNGWSIVTADGSLSGCFEDTIAVTDENAFILT